MPKYKENLKVRISISLSNEEGASIRAYVKGWGSLSSYNLRQLSRELEIDSGQFTRILQGKGAIAQEKLEKLYVLLKAPRELSFIEAYLATFEGKMPIRKSSSPSDCLYASAKKRLDCLYEQAQQSQKSEILSGLELLLQYQSKKNTFSEEIKSKGDTKNG